MELFVLAEGVQEVRLVPDERAVEQLVTAGLDPPLRDRALVNRPEDVFLDEMTTGLDPAARRATLDLIEAVRDKGATVVLVSQFMDEAERLCDRVRSSTSAGW